MDDVLHVASRNYEILQIIRTNNRINFYSQIEIEQFIAKFFIY